MSKPDYIKSLLHYYSKFVPKTLLADNYRQPSQSRLDGYNELYTEISTRGDEDVISGIGTFIVSANRKYVMDKVKNSKGYVLFVEYGQFSYDPDATFGISEKIGITVARDYNIANNDNMNETLLMNECFNMLDQILSCMQADQDELNACGLGRLIEFPAEIYPVDPETFSDRSGWTALFSNKKTSRN